MPDFMTRIRGWFDSRHGAEHDEIKRRLNAQRIRIKRLDAYVDARQSQDRRRTFAAGHPGRREEDVR